MLHANANRVKISIKDIGDEICLCISDDGKGFDIKRQNQLFGFTSMRERVASINGHLTVESGHGKGTKIYIAVAKQFEKGINLH
jgi:signal transduction histidine kinase